MSQAQKSVQCVRSSSECVLCAFYSAAAEMSAFGLSFPVYSCSFLTGAIFRYGVHSELQQGGWHLSSLKGHIQSGKKRYTKNKNKYKNKNRPYRGRGEDGDDDEEEDVKADVPASPAQINLAGWRAQLLRNREMIEKHKMEQKKKKQQVRIRKDGNQMASFLQCKLKLP